MSPHQLKLLVVGDKLRLQTHGREGVVIKRHGKFVFVQWDGVEDGEWYTERDASLLHHTGNTLNE